MHRADILGLLLALGLACWILLSAALVAGSSIGPIGTLTMAAIAFLVGRLVGRRSAGAIPFGIAIGVLCLGAWSWRALIDRDPLGGPLGYQNADAALFLQAFVASILLITISTPRRRAIPAVLATLLGVSLVVIGSTAAVILAAAVSAVAIVVLVFRRRVPATVIGGGFLLCLSVGVVLGVTYSPESGAGIAASSTETRLGLWHDALRLMGEHPIFGIGGGRFAEQSPVAAADPDTRHAHQEYMEIGVESGVIAGALLAAVMTWTIVRTGSDHGVAGTIAAAGVAALGIHACVDYVLHFPLVPITAAILAGAASFRDRTIPDDSEGDR